MAVFQDTLYTQILADASQATAELDKFASLGKKMGFITKAGGDVQHQVDQLEESLGKGSAAFKVFNSNLKESKRRFDMNILSWMFGGMALYRYSLIATRFFIPSSERLNELNTVGAKKTLAVGAAFEFLKVSMFETLSNLPLFQSFVEWIVKAAIWISEFAQKHPTIVAIAAALSGIGVILGALAMGTGIIMQINHLIGLLGFTEGGAETGKGLAGVIKKIATKLAGTALLVYVGLKLFDALTNETSSSWGEIIVNSIMAGLGAALVFNPATGIITGLVVLATFAFDKIKDDAIRDRLEESKVKIQTIFNKLGKEGAGLDLQAFDTLFGNALNYTGSSELKKIAKNLKTDLMLEILDEDAYRIQMANLFGTISRTKEGSPLIGIADLSKEEYGFDSFENMWLGVMDEQLASAIDNSLLIKDAYENMAFLSGETIQTNIINRVDDWQPKEKTLTIRAKYVGFGNDDDMTANISNTSSITSG